MTEPLVSPDGRQAAYFHDASHMPEIKDESAALAVTSPPYAIGLRYYGEGKEPAPGQIEKPVLSMADYEAYQRRLEPVWGELQRKIAPGGYVAINIAPIHSKSEFFGESFMFPIVEDVSHYWRKVLGWQNRWKYYWLAARTSNNSKGEHSGVMGSYPKPLEGQVLRSAEEILIFRKPGGREYTPERMEQRRKSHLTLQEWRDSFSQTWVFPGARKEENEDGDLHMAPFPEELPARIIRGYSCVGDLVIDPFLGTGTTLLACRKLGRRCVGYEVQTEWRQLIAKKTKMLAPSSGMPTRIDVADEVEG